jgi:ankyrin repeat protein
VADYKYEKRVALNITNVNGETALHAAVKAGKKQIVETLISNWADITMPSEQVILLS